MLSWRDRLAGEYGQEASPYVASVVSAPTSPTIPVAADLGLEQVATPVAEEPLAAPSEEAPVAPVEEGARPWWSRGRQLRKARAAAEQAQLASAVEPEESVVEPEAVEPAAPASAAVTAPLAYTLLPTPGRPGGYELPETELEAEPEGAEVIEPAAEEKPKRRRSTILILLLAVVLLVGAVVTGGLAVCQSSHQNGTFRDLMGNKVAPEDNSINDPAYVQAADAKPDIGLRFKIPSVDLDVALGSVKSVNGVINPPGFTSAFLIRDFGLGTDLENADKGTIYVATHALRSPGKAPGNYVVDQNGNILVQDGAEIDVGGRVYKVVSSETVLKTDLGLQANLWSDTPGMLVFVTCLESGSAIITNGHSDTNVVIIGTLVS